MKLYATLETSRGKTVSVSDNSEIVATVYDGNLKAYSVIISFQDIGDPQHACCNNCGWTGELDELDRLSDSTELCPDCKKANVDIVPAVMGAIVTTREWRNQTDDRRKAQGKA